jgi:hypothetical protein
MEKLFLNPSTLSLSLSLSLSGSWEIVDLLLWGGESVCFCGIFDALMPLRVLPDGTRLSFDHGHAVVAAHMTSCTSFGGLDWLF